MELTTARPCRRRSEQLKSSGRRSSKHLSVPSWRKRRRRCCSTAKKAETSRIREQLVEASAAVKEREDKCRDAVGVKHRSLSPSLSSPARWPSAFRTVGFFV